MRRLRITVDGRSYNVLVEDLGDGGEPYERAIPAHVAPAPPLAQAPLASPAPASPGSVVAPLGGTVQAISVAVGAAVAVGDEVAIIEAMKMKNIVRAQVAGRVVSIAVAANQGVETGQLLMTLA